MIKCDGKQKLHDPVVIGEDENALRWICKECKGGGVIRKDPNKNVPEVRAYVKVFRREALQGNDNLFYKYYEQFLRK